MTRQKKEILKKIDELEGFMSAEIELGCGFTPNDFLKPIEMQIYCLQEQLASLQHYDSVTDMMFDMRGCPEYM